MRKHILKEVDGFPEDDIQRFYLISTHVTHMIFICMYTHTHTHEHVHTCTYRHLYVEISGLVHLTNSCTCHPLNKSLEFPYGNCCQLLNFTFELGINLNYYINVCFSLNICTLCIVSAFVNLGMGCKSFVSGIQVKQFSICRTKCLILSFKSPFQEGC